VVATIGAGVHGGEICEKGFEEGLDDGDLGSGGFGTDDLSSRVEIAPD